MLTNRPSIHERYTSSFNENDLNEAMGKQTEKPDDMADPNDETPGFTGSWNPASLVTAAQSKQSGRTDSQGYYRQVRGNRATVTSTTTGRFRGLFSNIAKEEMPIDYNLQSIGRSDSTLSRNTKPKKQKQKRGLARDDSIVWGDESTMLGIDQSDREEEDATNDQDDGDVEKQAMEVENFVDDCSYADHDDALRNFQLNEKLVRELMWQRDRRRLGICFFVLLVPLGIGLGIFFTQKRYTRDNVHVRNEDGNLSYTFIPSDTTLTAKKDAPSKPVPLAPGLEFDMDSFDTTSTHTMALADVTSVINRITSDPKVLSDSSSPQSLAVKWLNNDVKIHKFDIEERVAQRYALATLYYATNGTGWIDNTNWGNGHECNWHGVGCEKYDDGRVAVTYIDLNSNGLVGEIPQEIGHVHSLTQSKCAGVYFASHCSIGWSTDILKVMMWGNSLQGPIPSSLSRLTQLHTLYLDKNELDGELGDTLDSLKSLKHLDLSDNMFRGHIPHGIGNLIALRDVRLSNNFFSGSFPVSMISLSNLETLLINNNSIGGTVPSLLGKMKSLITVRVHDNDMKGKIPSFESAESLEELQ